MLAPSGSHEALFQDLRFDADGSERRDFPLNQPVWRDAKIIVAGRNFGCGSSREQAPYSEVAAGVKLVIAASIEKIYRQNAQNIGLLTSTDFTLVARIRAGEAIPMVEFTKGLDPISAAIVEHGGLFSYNKERLAGRVSPPALTTEARPMTLCEKILARHAVVDARAEELHVSDALQAGESVLYVQGCVI